MNIKIFVITHRDIEISNFKSICKPMLVGAYDKSDALSKKYVFDSTNDNISARNNAYCEMTGLDWLWKNSSEEFLGLVHYRRFFINCSAFRYNERLFKTKNNNWQLIDEKEIEKALNKYEIIVKKSPLCYKGNRNAFSSMIGEENWYELEKLFYNKYSDYLDSFRKYEKKLHHINCNMFIAKKELIDKYCEWVFELLKDLDDNHFIKCGKYYQNRELGLLEKQ